MEKILASLNGYTFTMLALRDAQWIEYFDSMSKLTEEELDKIDGTDGYSAFRAWLLTWEPSPVVKALHDEAEAYRNSIAQAHEETVEVLENRIKDLDKEYEERLKRQAQNHLHELSDERDSMYYKAWNDEI